MLEVREGCWVVSVCGVVDGSQSCGQECRPGTSVCDEHLAVVRRELLHVPAVGQALEAARTKQMRLGGIRPDRAPRPEDVEESPLPYNQGVARVEAEWLSELRTVSGALGRRLGAAPPADLCVWARGSRVPR